MNSSFNIIPLNNAHCRQIIDLILPIQQIEFNVPVTLEGQPDLLDIETNYHHTGGNFWGVMLGDELVGTIALIAIGGRAGAIRKMFVRKEYRGKELGIGQVLLNELIAFCRQHDIDSLYLGTVEQLKAAHRFYEKNGFTRLPVHDLPPSFPLMGSDNIFYELHLTN
jgi:GNAT superfamily N-acetyltransferase